MVMSGKGNCDKCHYATRKRKDDSGVCARYPKWVDIYDMTEHFCGEFAWAGSVSPLKGDRMSEYVCELTAIDSETWDTEVREEIVRCRDCKHATISNLGHCKYCEMFVIPDMDGYGADPQVNLPLDFFCAYGERKETAE